MSSAEVVLSLWSNILLYPLSSAHTHTHTHTHTRPGLRPLNLSMTSERQHTHCCSSVSVVFVNGFWAWLVTEMREFNNAAEALKHTQTRIPGVWLFDPVRLWREVREGQHSRGKDRVSSCLLHSTPDREDFLVLHLEMMPGQCDADRMNTSSSFNLYL